MQRTVRIPAPRRHPRRTPAKGSPFKGPFRLPRMLAVPDQTLGGLLNEDAINAAALADKHF